jgi:ATP-dependent protease ClpP protease subunit
MQPLDDAKRMLLQQPNVRLYGPIDDKGVRDCLDQLRAVLETEKPIVFELTTEGGDAEGGRRIALEIRLCRRWHGRETFFVGKTAVMSAGVTIMAAFANHDRFLTDDAVLLVHERQLQRTLDLRGPVRGGLQKVREMLAQLETAERVEREGFAELAAGSRLDVEDLYRRAADGYYIAAREALDLGLVAALL